MGMGRRAKRKSVAMLMILLKRPMLENVCGLKHLVEGLAARARFQEARTGTQEKIRVPAQAREKHVRKASE